MERVMARVNKKYWGSMRRDRRSRDDRLWNACLGEREPVNEADRVQEFYMCSVVTKPKCRDDWMANEWTQDGCPV